MAGGIIQIVTYGAQDLYLTGTPQITFFKIVYRRYTNFSIESVKVEFDDPVGFGRTSMLTVPKVGDLIHKTYLEIILPEIILKRSLNQEQIMEAENEYNIAKNNYEIVINFLYVNRKAYIDAYEICQAENNNNVSSIITAVCDVFDDPDQFIQDSITNFTNLINNYINPPFTYDEISMKSIVNNFNSMSSKSAICNALEIGIKKSIKIQKFFYDILLDKKYNLEDKQNCHIKFAWVNRVGHAILDQIEIRIGGQVIDRHYGDWLNIWYELSANRNLEEKYFKLIGNIPILTDFNREPKPEYKLRIPLQFWFNRFSGLSLPLVSLEYHDVTFHVKFRKLEQLSYVENNTLIRLPYDPDEGFHLDEISDIADINIRASMLIDYVYLDGPERRRFAQSSHEYLIQQLQLFEMNDVTLGNIQIVLENFVHPMIELIWVAQLNSLVNNNTGFKKSDWFNYTNPADNESTIEFSTINFHGYTRSMRLRNNYYNYVQPYAYHNTSPSEGINMYSFALFPEESQPSGSANMSRLSKVSLLLEFDPILFSGQLIVIDSLNVRVYGRNMNILRFVSGMAGTAFTYG